ncbi:MAG: peptidoglycan DD-metalloendopeptidase family protein [Psychroserpens sp.]|uniref:M23 family metallopeptidase n=1 Tax=Psychroserpens sp. TaxID=2020870 RepID=UPI003002CA5D
MQPKKILIALFICIGLWSCKDDDKKVGTIEDLETLVEPEPKREFGFVLEDYIVKRDTIRKGDSFGEILERNQIGYPRIFNIAEKAKDSFDIRNLNIGKPYTLLCTNDSLQTPQCFIYQPNSVDYVVISFADSIHAYTSRKDIKYVEKTATGIIPDGMGISQLMIEQGLSPRLAYKMADEIYAWTIDFRRLQEGDRFKVIYTDKYIDDSIYVGVHDIKAVYFEHKKKPFYAFQFETDSVKGVIDYFNDEAKNLRRAFLKGPVQFSRISSRYNLNRRIKYYGYKLRPHKGTDFAAAIGTPILATANGTVSESTRRGGNGKYVKIRHNATYSTQYLHMKAQNVKKGDFVKQGDVIGWIGMTGNTGGPHVCYRFWKNGKQVDPLRQKLPEAKPISDSLKVRYLDFIAPIKIRLDDIKIKDSFNEFPINIEEDSILQLQ